MAKPNSNAPVGQGGRFAALQNQFAQQGKSNPGGLAAAIGNKKYGKSKMSRMAAVGRRLKSHGKHP